MIRLGLALLLGSGCAETQGPRLEAVTPPAARKGDFVVLSGQRLCGADGSCESAGGEVQFGLELPAVRARIVRYEDREAEVEVPDLVGVGPTTIVVTVNEYASNAIDFEVLP